MEAVLSGLHSFVVDRINRVRGWITQSSAVAKLYAAGLLLAAVALFAPVLLPLPARTSEVLMLGGAAMTGAAFAIEAYNRVLRWSRTRIGKLCGALVMAAIVPVAMGTSADIVNQATGLQPAYFPYAVAALAPFTAGYFISLVSLSVLVFGFLAAFANFLFGTFAWTREERDSKLGWLGMRVMGGASFALLIALAWQSTLPDYERTLHQVARVAVVSLDTYAKDDCAAGPQERIKRVTDTLVVVATTSDKSVVFTKRTCPLTAS